MVSVVVVSVVVVSVVVESVVVVSVVVVSGVVISRGPTNYLLLKNKVTITSARMK